MLATACAVARKASVWLAFAVVLAASACSSSKLEDPNAPSVAGASEAGNSGFAGSLGLAGDDTGGATTPASETIQVFDTARITSDMSLPNFQQQTADLDFGAGPFTSVRLIADLGTTCFPFASWKDDPPPSGQNWPADCDAFDRNFELSLDDPEPGADAGSTPGLELVRAITPFGGPMHIERYLTVIANAQPGAHRLRAHITTYADGAGKVTGSDAGWNITLRVELVRGPAAQRPLAVVPLFYGDLSTDEPMKASFRVPEGTLQGFLEYRTTGHGQGQGDTFKCKGPAEEFCSRQHTIELDGEVIKTFTPWRSCASACTLVTTDTDAGFDYCAENPCGAIDSVKAPRANWCPGTESGPLVLDAAGLATPGTHEASWHVSEIATGGIVRVSLTYYAFAD
ncbi:MAG: peptide-N-glycosidase F-related protein [Myxococcales bacterium]